MFNIKPAEFCPPMLNGVSASKVFLPKMTPAPHTVLAYLSDQFPHIEAAEWQQRFHDGLVYDAVGNEHHTDSLSLLAHEDQCPICKFEFAKYTKTEICEELSPRNILFAILGESIVLIELRPKNTHNYIRGPPFTL